MLDELEDRQDFMNSTLTLAQKHNIDFVQETEISPQKQPIKEKTCQINSDSGDHIDPEQLRDVNTTPTFQDAHINLDNEDEDALNISEQHHLNNSALILNCDDKEDSYIETDHNKFNLRLMPCDEKAQSPVKDDSPVYESPMKKPVHLPMDKVDSNTDSDEDESESEELQESPVKVDLQTKKRSEAFGSINSLNKNKPSSFALSESQMLKIQQLKDQRKEKHENDRENDFSSACDAESYDRVEAKKREILQRLTQME